MNDNSRDGSPDRDFQLLAEYIGGDSQALGSLLLKYQEAARALARRYVYPDTHLADDIVQEANTSVIQSVAGFRRDSKFTTWYYSIIRNVAHEYLRRMCTEKRSPRREERRVDETMAGSNDDPVENVLTNERMEIVEKLLSNLQLRSPQKYDVVMLRYFEDLPFAEISKRQGITLYNAKIQWQRALGILREILNDGTFDLEIDNG